MKTKKHPNPIVDKRNPPTQDEFENLRKHRAEEAALFSRAKTQIVSLNNAVASAGDVHAAALDKIKELEQKLNKASYIIGNIMISGVPTTRSWNMGKPPDVLGMEK